MSVEHCRCSAAPHQIAPTLWLPELSDPNITSIPDGLSQDPNTGLVAGTNTGQGVYQPLFIVADATGATVSKELDMAIDGDNTGFNTGFFPPDNFNHGGFDITQAGFWQYTITSDARWNDADLACIHTLGTADYVMKNMSSLITADSSGRPLSMKVRGATPSLRHSLLRTPYSRSFGRAAAVLLGALR